MQPLSLSSNVYRVSLVAKPVFYSANSYETWEYNQTLPVPEQDYTTSNLESSYFSFRSGHFSLSWSSFGLYQTSRNNGCLPEEEITGTTGQREPCCKNLLA